MRDEQDAMVSAHLSVINDPKNNDKFRKLSTRIISDESDIPAAFQGRTLPAPHMEYLHSNDDLREQIKIFHASIARIEHELKRREYEGRRAALKFLEKKFATPAAGDSQTF